VLRLYTIRDEQGHIHPIDAAALGLRAHGLPAPSDPARLKAWAKPR
jgi:hypothetical protein